MSRPPLESAKKIKKIEEEQKENRRLSEVSYNNRLGIIQSQLLAKENLAAQEKKQQERDTASAAVLAKGRSNNWGRNTNSLVAGKEVEPVQPYSSVMGARGC
ncbi:MAG: hypothetical protein NTU49_06150 [Gammaproteobacteria bacterium]|nr:hypothetical protein [Gammaproteobacteria bacterium]